VYSINATFVTSCNTAKVLSLDVPPPKYIRVIEILLALLLVDGRGTITSKERTFAVLQLVTNVALIDIFVIKLFSYDLKDHTFILQK
jgi:hypothetical protein